MFAPAKTPRAIVDRFGQDLRASLAEERAARTLKDAQQIDVIAAGPEDLQRFVETEMRVWGAVVRENNIKADS